MIDSTLITDPYIYVEDNVLSKFRCEEIINKYENDENIIQGETGLGVDLDIKNSKSEDQKYYQIILKYSKGAVLDFIVIKKYFYKIKTVLDINSV